jgi:N-methylhydantoinase A
MRYIGQSYTLSVPCDPQTATWDGLRKAFGDRHAQTFGYADASNDAEIVNVRLVSLGIVDKPALAFAPEAEGDPLIEERPVWFGDGWVDCPVLDRAKMPEGYAFTGPAIVEEAGGTSVVPPGWTVTVLPSGTLDCRYAG